MWRMKALILAVFSVLMLTSTASAQLDPIGFCADDGRQGTSFRRLGLVQNCYDWMARDGAIAQAIREAERAARDNCGAWFNAQRAQTVCNNLGASFSPGAALDIHIQPPSQPARTVGFINRTAGSCFRTSLVEPVTTRSVAGSCSTLFTWWQPTQAGTRALSRCGYVCR